MPPLSEISLLILSHSIKARSALSFYFALSSPPLPPFPPPSSTHLSLFLFFFLLLLRARVLDHTYRHYLEDVIALFMHPSGAEHMLLAKGFSALDPRFCGFVDKYSPISAKIFFYYFFSMIAQIRKHRRYGRKKFDNDLKNENIVTLINFLSWISCFVSDSSE